MNKRQRGLTLVELLVVLLIIAIASAVVIPNFGGRLRGARLREAALTFAEHLRFAQLLALEKERAIRVTLDRKTNAYRLELASNLDGLQFEPLAELGASGSVMLPEGVVWGEVNAGQCAADQSEGLMFDPAGAWSSGQVTISNGQSKWVVQVGIGKRIDAFECTPPTVEEAQPASLGAK